MNKKIWDIYAPVYELAMRKDKNAYDKMIENISSHVSNKDVLEVATGPGIIARQIAPLCHLIIASDYSKGMIEQASKTNTADNLIFEVADTTSLPYSNQQFDIVIIANALHVMPDPVLALSQIKRVLKDNGLLIAPNFVNHKKKLWASPLKIAGIQFDNQWSDVQYEKFIENNGFTIIHKELLNSRIPMDYVECIKNNEK